MGKINLDALDDLLLDEYEWEFGDAGVDTHLPCFYGIHKWKLYVGLTETYEYCVHCDLKKGEKDGQGIAIER